jgi:hypothetical protein
MNNFNFLMNIFSELLGSLPIEDQRLFDVSVKKIKKTRRGRPHRLMFHGRGWAREGKSKEQTWRGKETVGEEREDRGEKSEVINVFLIQFSLCFQTRGD